MWSARMLRWLEAGVGSGTALSRCLKTMSWACHTHARDRHTRYLFGNEALPCSQHPGAPLPDPQWETTTLILVCSDAFHCCMFYATGVRRCSACSTKRILQRASFLCLASRVHGDLGDCSPTWGAAVSGSPPGSRGFWGGKGPRVWSGLVGRPRL